VPLDETCEVHRLDVLLLRVGAEGRYPGILSHPQYGAAARELFEHAQALLEADHRREAADRARRLRLLAGEQRRRRHRRLHGRFAAGRAGAVPMLRQQEIIADQKPNRRSRISSRRARAACPTTSGMFAVTAGLGADELVRPLRADHDDYHAIMVKAIADRLAEAFAEYLHAQAGRTGATAKPNNWATRS
jgi:5-methyltetrahydrofolate--homocysteine methyltransferase